MDRLSALFEQLSLPETLRVLRTAAFGAVALGAIALITAIVLHRPLVGAGAVVGLGLGFLNVQIAIGTARKVRVAFPDRPGRAFVVKNVYRLALTTLVVIGLLVASVQLGFATIGGIGAYYLVLIASLFASLLGGTART